MNESDAKKIMDAGITKLKIRSILNCAVEVRRLCQSAMATTWPTASLLQLAKRWALSRRSPSANPARS